MIKFEVGNRPGPPTWKGLLAFSGRLINSKAMLALVTLSLSQSVTVDTLHGAGTTNPSRLFWQAMR